MEPSKILALSERIKSVADQNLNEAMTKTSLVMPFLQAMGYDVFDHTEVFAEYTSDFGTKKGEKIDFALLREGKPVILIECKPLGTKLSIDNCSQLFRYFSTHPEVRIGILTNGSSYLFFSDIDKTHVMDNKPFMEIDFLSFNERYLSELQKLTKDSWDIKGAISSASALKYVNQVKLFFGEDMANPSESLVKYYAGKVYCGHLTAKVKEEFEPIVKRAFSEFINDQINLRLESAKVTNNIPNEPISASIAETIEEKDEGIFTTDEEKKALVMLQAILRSSVDPKRVAMRDAKSYCAILLDDNNRKPICRLFLEGKRKSIILFNTEPPNRVYIDDVDGIYSCEEQLKQTILIYEGMVTE